MTSRLFIIGLIALLSNAVMAQPLSGNYTIGSGGDYNDFTNAVADLNSNGVNAPVVFNIISGTYTEQISLNEITGASSTNTITFQSSSGVNTDVTLKFASSNVFSTPNYVVQLKGSDYVTFQNMTIQRTGLELYACVVDIMGDASNNTFQGNRLLGKVGATNNNGVNIYSGDDNAGNMNNTFSNNIIRDGHAGIWWESSSGNAKSGLNVSGNIFSNYRYGLLLDYVNDIVITGNSITNAVSFNNAQTKGIDCFRCEQDITITRNNIILTDASSNYGIDLQASVGSASEVGNISNNMIVVGGTGTSHGINSGSLTAYKNYYFNSVKTTGTNATSSSAYYQNGSNNINLKNNVFVATSGNAVEILAPISGLLSSDYNDFYTTGPAVANWGGSNAADLTAWQGLTPAGFDVNSVSADPVFISSTDLHASGAAIENVGMPISGITEDIDREVRDANNPNMGADEFSNVPSCAGFMITSVTKSDISCFGQADGVISISASGGTTPYEYSIDSGSTWQPNLIFLSLNPGDYHVLVRDSTNCIVIDINNPVVIAEPLALSLSFSTTDETTPGANEGAIDLTVTGGIGAYSFLWSNNEITEDLNNLTSGTYCVLVTDDNDCAINACDTVSTASPGCQGLMIDDVVSINLSCNGSDDGEITINHSGGTAPVSFSIDSGDTWQTNNSTFSGLRPGKYFVFIRDDNNCRTAYANNPVIVTEPPANNPTIAQDGNALTANGGAGYQWFLNGNPISGAMSQKYAVQESGQYHVQVTYANGCSENTPVLEVIISGVIESGFFDKLVISPNPGSDRIRLTTSLKQNASIEIDLLDIVGNKLIPTTGYNDNIIDQNIYINTLSTGLYFLRIKAGKAIIFRRILKI